MLASIQGLRAVAALLVLLFHIDIVDRKYSGGGILPGAIRFGDAGVDLFFVISGFIIGELMTHEPKSLSRAANFLARRLLRIVPPYWMYTTLAVLAMAAFPGEINRSYGDQSILKSYLLIPQETLPVLTVGWTLIHEAYFYVVTCVMLAATPRHVLPSCLVGWSLVCTFVWFVIEPASPVLRLCSHPMTLEFTLGIALSLLVKLVPRSVAPALVWFGALGLTMGMGWLAEIDAPTTPLHYRVAVFGGASALLLLGLARWESAFGSPFPEFLKVVGDSSFSIYLSHVFVISAISRLWSFADFFESTAGHVAFILAAVTLSVLIGRVSHRVIERPLLMLSRRLLDRSGRRKDTCTALPS